jgi:hypothetical protein
MIWLKTAMTVLSGTTLLTKALIALGFGATLLAAYGEWHHHVYRQGVDAAIAGIARADKGWIDRASAARGKWKDCNAQNRDWDQTTGRCL